MIIFSQPSSGIAAVAGPWALRLRPSGLGEVRQGSSASEMNDPLDTYASTTSCMHHQLNRISRYHHTMISYELLQRYRTTTIIMLPLLPSTRIASLPLLFPSPTFSSFQLPSELPVTL